MNKSSINEVLWVLSRLIILFTKPLEVSDEQLKSIIAMWLSFSMIASYIVYKFKKMQ